MTALTKTNNQLASNIVPKVRVYIQPLNEGQELNYQVSFTGTAQEIVREALRIINGLKGVLTEGDFSVRVENAGDLENVVVVTTENILDQNFEIIGTLEDFQLNAH